MRGTAAAAAAAVPGNGGMVSLVLPALQARIRADPGYWRPAAVVAVARPGSPLDRILAGLLGQPSFRASALIVWRR